MLILPDKLNVYLHKACPYYLLVSEEKEEEEPEDTGLDDWEAMASDEEKGEYLLENRMIKCSEISASFVVKNWVVFLVVKIVQVSSVAHCEPRGVLV